MPGFSSHINGGRYSESGGNGGGWAGLCRSWSLRSVLTGVFPGKNYDGQIKMEVYHKDSTNLHGGATPKNHPCIDPNNRDLAKTGKLQYGESFNSNGHIRDNKWHKITHHVKLNDIGSSNGFFEIFLDDKLIGKMTNLNLTDNPKYHNLAFWFIVYHGGAPDKTGTSHDVFFADFNWNAGPVNKTK